MWSDLKWDPYNSKLKDVLKVSAQLRGSCSQHGKRWEGGDRMF